jgi:hypothetical protein
MRKPILLILSTVLLALGGFALLMVSLPTPVATGLAATLSPGPGLTDAADPPDAQSTSGPTPPPGINMAGGHIASESAVTIPNVPAYTWHHGCGPTAAGMVIGYWDGQGFDDLVSGNAVTQTTAVTAMIASEGPASNYTDYCEPIDYSPNLLPDKSEPPLGDEHPDDCVADYMKTSQSYHGNYYGWSWFSAVGPAMKGYADALGRDDYRATTNNLYMAWGSSLNWDSFRAEIDASRPMVLLVDTNGNGGTDHFVTAIGYDVVDDVQKYACLNTWDTGIHWFDFAPMASGQSWGIYGGTTFQMEQYLEPPTAVAVSGQTTVVVQTEYTFNAVVSPITATQPITYIWQATTQSPVTHTGGPNDSVTFSWNITGPKTIAVTATNAFDTVTDTYEIQVIQGHKVYLPLVLRSHSP